MNLASIERITNIQPIENADKIVLDFIQGWQVIIKKDEYNVGDFCVYVPIDTMVDTSQPYFSFLADKNNPQTFVRIKTIKLKGKWSQGIIIPFNVLNQIEPNQTFTEGQDVGQLLGVKKYEKENIIVPTGITTYNKPFPTEIISITDEDNLKTKFKVIEELKNNKLYITQKLDGSSMTIIKNQDDFIVCSRRLILEEGAVMYQFVNENKIKETIQSYGKNIAIQGEFCGPKINNNQLGLKNYKFYVFNIKNLDTKNYYNLDQLKQTTEKLKLEMVPVIKIIEPTNEITLDYFQLIANEQMYIHPNNKKVPGEGIVIRPIEPIYSNELNKNLSVKVINQNYRD